MKRLAAFAALLLFSAPALQASPQEAMSDAFATALTLPDKHTVYVSEGADEPQSMGSYAVRLYAPAGPSGLRFERFLDGKIAHRHGKLIKLEAADIDGDGKQEVIVIIQSAGSGGYLDAEAWMINNNQIQLMTTVGGMKPNVNPIHEMIRAYQVMSSE